MKQIQVELQEWMGSDKSIAEAAWTSSTTNKIKKKKTYKEISNLVKRLAKDKHSTPFESVVFRFWIKMPIQTDREHMTHRIGSHNGMSGRYRTMPREWLKTPNDIKKILRKLKSSIDYEKEYETFCSKINYWYEHRISIFKDREKEGKINNNEYKRLREFFRGILPQNNMTERVTIFNLRSFANYQKLRNSKYAQPEIKLVAKLMLEEVKKKKIAPIAIKWLENNNWQI